MSRQRTTNSSAPIICCVQNIHIRELTERIGWMIGLRQGFILATLLLSVTAATPIAPPGLSPLPPLLVALMLTVANRLWQWRLRQLERECVGTLELRTLAAAQVAVDDLGLTILVYATGGIETPLPFLVIPNLLVAALFFNRLQALLATLGGTLLVCLPIVLESAGLLSTVQLFEGGLKSMLLSTPLLLPLYLATLLVTTLLCWHIATTLTGELIDSELELEESYQAMVRLDEEKSLATLRGTHELKAPLAAIKSYASVLRDGYAGKLPERAHDISLRIAARCDLLLEKITDVIRLGNLRSYVNSGSQFTPLPLLPALAQLIEDARPLAEPNRIALNLECDAKPWVNASQEAIATLFTNLLDNAIHYSHPDGKVEIRCSENGWEAIVSIRDHGIGIAADEQRAILREHYRARNAVEHHPGGTGLGMPIVTTIVDLLGGKFALESSPGAGTRIEIRLPTTEPPIHPEEERNGTHTDH